MKQLTCEMCGSTDLVKQDGFFVCQSCGCKYSVEEAKKMMIEGVVVVDNSHLVENYLEMAMTARGSGNNSEAEAYCNKIIEIEPTNYRAWLLKGEAAAWQSTLSNLRFNEGVAAFIKGITYAPEEEKDEIFDDIKEEIKSLSISLIKLRGERFEKWPDKEETNGFVSDLSAIIQSVVLFIKNTGRIIPTNELMAPIVTKINNSISNAWSNVISPEYSEDTDDRPNKYEWEKYIARIGNCTTLLSKAIELCSDDDEDDITMYENLIFLHKKAIDSCAWERKYSAYGSYWSKSWTLTESAKNSRRSLINAYEDMIKTIKKKIEAKKASEKAQKELIASIKAKKRFDNYWEEHEEDKKALQAEKNDLEEKIITINTSLNVIVEEIKKEISDIPGDSEIKSIDEKIKSLTYEKDSLGLFKVKQKKALQDQIDSFVSRKQEIEKRMSLEKKKVGS